MFIYIIFLILKKKNLNDDSCDSDIDDNVNLNEKNGFLKVIDEENNNKNLSENNENDLNMQMNWEITNKGNQEIIFSQTKNNNNHSNNINNNDNWQLYIFYINFFVK